MTLPEPVLSAIPGLCFDHFGVACRDLSTEIACWHAFGYQCRGPRWSDPLQGVDLQFMEGAGPRIELIAPHSGSTLLDPYLRGPSRIYHVGYRATDIDDALTRLAHQGRVVSPLKPAVAFSGARVGFVLLRNLLLIEIIEQSP